MRAALALVLVLAAVAPAAAGVTLAQAPNQAPGQPRPGEPAPNRPAPAPVPTLEELVRQGYEVRAMQQYGGQAGQFVVMLQRSGDVRTCLMRIERPQGGAPARRTVCF